MKVFTREMPDYAKPDTFIIILDMKESKLLHEMLEAACTANKRKSKFKTFFNKIDEMLACW